VKKGNINFEKFPVAPLQFDILKIERRKKKKLSKRARPRACPSFLGKVSGPRESGVGNEREKNGE
jgi:hypothetical protein